MRYFGVLVASSRGILLFTVARACRLFNCFDMSFDLLPTITSLSMADSIPVSRDVVLGQAMYKPVSCLRGFLVEPHPVPKPQSGDGNSCVMKGEVLLSCFSRLGKPSNLRSNRRFCSALAIFGGSAIPGLD